MDLKYFNLIVDGYMSGGVALFGILGNILCIFIYSKKEFRKHPVEILILGLSVSDFIASVINIVNGVLVVLQQSVGVSLNLQKVLLTFEIYYPYCFSFAQACSIYHTLGIALERYIAIRYPFKVKFFCTMKNSRFLTIGIFICSSLIMLPELWIYTWVDGVAPKFPKTEPSIFAKSYEYYIFRRYVLKIFVYILPFMLLVVFNVLIIATFRKARRLRADLGIVVNERNCGHPNNDGVICDQKTGAPSRITRTLLCVVICFAVCYVPEIIVSLHLVMSGEQLLFLSTFDPNSNKPIWSYMVTINGFLFTINSSLNFIIYSIMNRKFRNEIQKILCLPCTKCVVFLKD